MIPFNNLSVLPFYSSLSEQNARKWWVYGKVFPLFCPALQILPFQVIRSSTTSGSLTEFKIYRKDGSLVGEYASSLSSYIYTKSITAGSSTYQVIVYPGQMSVFSSMNDGQYYIKMTYGGETWYSEIYTAVNDTSCLLKLTWRDTEDFVMDAGAIVYTSPTFTNVLYLPADVARPEYTFEEDVEERDGYSFPMKQISKKVYHFGFLAPEFLLDVLRFVRMSDYVTIVYNGKTFSVDSFLITPEWEDQGDIASVDAEFTTATVAKRIGLDYTRAVRGDFNDDFNNDFNNQ